MIIRGDCLEEIAKLKDSSVDALVTDPPAGISFMNKKWDNDRGGRDHWIDWLSNVMRECYRVMKPGAHGFVWAIPRTSHWTAFALENAGFEIRDVCTHLFGSGFPKSHNISKAIDKKFGAEREKIKKGNPMSSLGSMHDDNWNSDKDYYETKPTTNEAKQWDGWGTALKPASEHWILIRKPLSEKSVADNILRWGCGGINIDVSRIPGSWNWGKTKTNIKGGAFKEGFKQERAEEDIKSNPAGRFPANLILSHTIWCEHVGVKEVKAIKGGNSRAIQKNTYNDYGKNYDNRPNGKPCGYGNEDGTETVDDWNCHESCPVRLLDEQSGQRPTSFRKNSSYGNPKAAQFKNIGNRGPILLNDSGGASRFFYVAKPSKRERNAGLEGMPEKTVSRMITGSGKPSGSVQERSAPNQPNRFTSNHQNHHPTVKSIRLMQYLIRMVTPNNGIVLDPFMGSGSTGLACKNLGFDFIGIEKEQEYFEIAKKRLNE